MATSYVDAINGQPLTISIDAVAWAQPVAASWLTRCRELNRLLRKSTHLLCAPSGEKSEKVWYAGVSGTSLAAGLERMAIAEKNLRDAIAAFPLDSRIYVARLQNGLVREEWVLYPDAFDDHVRTWRSEGRNFTVLTGGGRLSLELPNAAHVPVDIDSNAMVFKHASLALLEVGLLRWRDCVLGFGVLAIAICASFLLALWQRTPIVEPLQRVAVLVTQSTDPVDYDASAKLAAIALQVANHDVALWQAHSVSELRYEAEHETLELHSTSSEPIKTPLVNVPKSPDVVSLEPYTIQAYETKLMHHLASPNWTLTFGEPYPVGMDSEFEKHVSISIGSSDKDYGKSISAILVELSERLRGLPIKLHQANCAISDGVFISCELRFSIRGLRA